MSEIAVDMEEERPGLPRRLAEGAGFALLVLAAFLVPIFFLPVTIYQQFDTDRAETIMAKVVLLQLLCGLALLVAAGLAAFSPALRAYRGGALLPVLFLCGFLAWGSLSVWQSPNPHFSLFLWLWMLFPGAAALTGPLFLRSDWRCRVLLIAAVAAGVLASLFTIVTVAGYEKFYYLMYGIEPSKMHEVVEAGHRLPQGGRMRAAAMSTLANAEYAGSYAAAIAALAAVMLFDWCGGSRRKWIARVVVFVAMALLLVQLALSGTRQPWIALMLAGLLRLLIELRVPPRAMAAGFGAFLLVVLFGGLLAGGVVLALAVGGAVLWAFLRGHAGAALRGADPLNRWLLFGGPALLLLLFVAFSVPGPWNPTGIRLYERFSSITNPRDESVRERLLMYAGASDIIWRKPVFGTGPGRFANEFYGAMATISEEDRSGVFAFYSRPFAAWVTEQSHNDYLQIAVELGLPGLALFLGAMTALLAALWRIVADRQDPRRRTALALMIGLVAFFSIMMTSFPLHMPSRTAVFWMLVAASLGLVASRRSDTP